MNPKYPATYWIFRITLGSRFHTALTLSGRPSAVFFSPAQITSEVVALVTIRKKCFPFTITVKTALLPVSRICITIHG